MKILISGSRGFIGTPLTERMAGQGHQIVRLVRKPESGAIFWDPYRRTIDQSLLENFDAVIHLAGRTIAGGRWTKSAKKEIFDSRILPTRFLAETLANLKHPPKTLVCASAVGFFGDRGDQVLTEDSAPGEGFLPELCLAWEKACDPARERGIRTINLRTSLVLASRGGALGPMFLPFKIGVGGRFGSGAQYMSWVSLSDVISIIEFALTHDSVSGPVNVAAPEPISNREFTTTLGRVLRRPTLFTMPAFAVRLLLGEMGDALLLSSARAIPEKLLKAGYKFLDTDIEETLRRLLDRPRK